MHVLLLFVFFWQPCNEKWKCAGVVTNVAAARENLMSSSVAGSSRSAATVSSGACRARPAACLQRSCQSAAQSPLPNSGGCAVAAGAECNAGKIS